jgi:hypothetical protein
MNDNKHTPAKIFNFITIDLGIWLVVVWLGVKLLTGLFGLFF